MKKTHLILLALFTPFISFSQNQNGISVGVKTLEYSDFSKLMNESRGNKYTPQLMYMNGLFIKFNDNEFNYKIQVSRLQKSNYSFFNYCQTCETVNGEYKGYEVTIGFEKNIGAGNLQPFLGTDIGFRDVSFQGLAHSVNKNAYLYNVDVDQNGGLITQSFGIKGNFFNSRITMSAQASIEIIFNYEKETKVNQQNEVISQDKYNRTRFNSRPLGGLSIMYNINP
ncbi:hypothetical protein Pedsa_1752 [Pseudopedobacter saltans DSM 12145]|uniref:Outer membrane protein beta-barrel domain-containing protein n=1 Tax=Pseudopedobacter saltans (strain ATCC 51119 / DSM 12145 / JCM 21818 / CCUG 39354 / LMG 10337 / NBRC 100064 / NCIMB 13643) TaxID=762903 RepID=F0S847_PSESL|nr:hypothetical protein [Pseudopedobacter saltans]ADY52309.1 hypothetical protein Pedsa_1752 [Pseudopedobacter saltans DSM 12145]